MAKTMSQAFFRIVLLMSFLLVLLAVAAKDERSVSGRNDMKGKHIGQVIFLS